MIYLASDHGGFYLKEKVKAFLMEHGHTIEDLGASQFVQDDDYPDFVIPAMQKLQKNPDHTAVVICKNGVGVSMLANKFVGIRCALSFSPQHAKSSKEDDDTNVLALPADYIDEKTALETVSAWLLSEFSEEERHKRRLNKVKEAES